MDQTYARKKFTRNDSCPCGSGKKFKKCCIGTIAPPLPPLTPKEIDAIVYENIVPLVEAQKLSAAMHLCNNILERNPNNTQVLHCAGVILKEAGQVELAIKLLSQAIDQDPKQASYYKDLSIAYGSIMKLDLALSAIERALELDPDNPESHNTMGANLLYLHRYEESAVSYKKALALEPNRETYYMNLAMCLAELNDYAGCRDVLARLLARIPNSSYALAIIMFVPNFMSSSAEIFQIRNRLDMDIDNLMQNNAVVSYNSSQVLMIPHFCLAYHNMRDKEIFMKLDQFYRQKFVGICSIADHCIGYQYDPKKKIKIAFISYYLFNHSVGKIFNRLIQDIAKFPEFEVSVVTKQGISDDLLVSLKEAVNHVVEVPLNCEYARNLVAEQKFDVIVYTDIGMNSHTFALSLSKLAPYQCVMAGHPNTSGVSSIDYFISSKITESENSQELYSEKLVLIEKPTFNIEKPTNIPTEFATREEMNIPVDKNVYLLPMKLQKIHPDYDFILRDILLKDPNGLIYVVQDNARDIWGKLLQQRFLANIPDVIDRILFIPWLRGAKYYHALNAVDVVLEPTTFGGGTTSYAVFAVGTPIITMPNESLRTRFTYALYQMMGLNEPVANSREEYVDIAIKIASDKAYRNSIRDKILQNNHKIYGDIGAADEMREMFQKMVRGEYIK